MSLRRKYKDDYLKFLESKGKVKRHTDYDRASDDLTPHLKKKVKNKIDFFGVSGVYYLIKEKKIVYIGESYCVYSRLSQHFKENIKDFDSFVIERINGEKQRKLAEKRAIKRHKPLLNSVHNPNN
jgi:hypothetical protein